MKTVDAVADDDRSPGEPSFTQYTTETNWHVLRTVDVSFACVYESREYIDTAITGAQNGVRHPLQHNRDGTKQLHYVAAGLKETAATVRRDQVVLANKRRSASRVAAVSTDVEPLKTTTRGTHTRRPEVTREGGGRGSEDL
ncbi:hypothetical protein MTO96_038066 [Rhipicephalus appendiculatus]